MTSRPSAPNVHAYITCLHHIAYVTSHKDINGKRQAEQREREQSRLWGGEGKKGGGGGQRTAWRQTDKQLNSTSRDSCLLCAGAGYMERATAQPCLCGFHIPGRPQGERVAETRQNQRERSRLILRSRSLGL